MEQTRQSTSENAQASFSGPQLAIRLSDELVFHILGMVNAEPKGWMSIIECSYASKAFHEMAMRLLWAHPGMVMERQTGDRFVVGARASGRHTRRLWLSAVQEHSLERGTAAIRFMPELEVLDVSGRMQNSTGPLEDWLASPSTRNYAQQWGWGNAANYTHLQSSSTSRSIALPSSRFSARRFLRPSSALISAASTTSTSASSPTCSVVAFSLSSARSR